VCVCVRVWGSVVVPRFSTKYLISITNVYCQGVCSIIPRVLRYRYQAKLFGVGGITGKSYPILFAYSGPAVNWNSEIAPLFQADSTVSSLPTSAAIVIPAAEAFISRFDVAETFIHIKPDAVIGWDAFSKSNPNRIFQFFDYMIEHPSRPRRLSKLPDFNPIGECYAKNGDGRPLIITVKQSDHENQGFNDDHSDEYDNDRRPENDDNDNHRPEDNHDHDNHDNNRPGYDNDNHDNNRPGDDHDNDDKHRPEYDNDNHDNHKPEDDNYNPNDNHRPEDDNDNNDHHRPGYHFKN